MAEQYRNFFPKHPNFPANLPTLSANVAQMRRMRLPPFDPLSPLPHSSLQIARSIRAELNVLRTQPDIAMNWLSVPTHRLAQAALEGKAQCMVPLEDETFINSNLRWVPSRTEGHSRHLGADLQKI